MMWWVVETTIVTAVLAAVVCLVGLVKRPSPAFQHALWLVVLVKFLVPPAVSWPWSLPGPLTDADRGGGALEEALESSGSPAPARESAPERALPAWHPGTPRGPDATSESAGTDPDSLGSVAARAARGVPPAALRGERAPARPEGVRGGETVLAPVVLEGALGEARAGSTRLAPAGAWTVPGTRWLWWLWAAGCAVFAFEEVRRNLRLAAWLRSGRAPAPSLRRRVDVLSRVVGVRCPRIVCIAELAPPFVWNVGRARLVVPLPVVEPLSADARDAVVLHELSHVARRDHWVGWLVLVARTIWWWNPLVWLVARRLRLYAELACDARVVQPVKDRRRPYAEALIDVTRSVAGRSVPSAACGMAASARRLFERRLSMIFREDVRPKLSYPSVLGVLLVSLLTLPGWTQGTSTVTPPAHPPAEDPRGPVAPPDATAELPPAPAGALGDPLASPPAPPPPAAEEALETVPAGGSDFGPPANSWAVFPATGDPRDPLSARIERLEKQLATLEAALQKITSGRGALKAAAVRPHGNMLLEARSANTAGSSTVDPAPVVSPAPTRSYSSAGGAATENAANSPARPFSQRPRSTASTTRRAFSPVAAASAARYAKEPSLDIVALATALADTDREKKIALVRCKSARSAPGTKEDTLVREIEYEAACSKMDIFLDLAEAALAAGREEIRDAERVHAQVVARYEAGRAPLDESLSASRDVSGLRARCSFLEALLKRFGRSE